MTTINITMERYGESGWQWTERFSYPYKDEIVTRSRRTNENGEGLWTVGEYDDSQISGTCQYELPYKRSSAYRKIRRDIERDIEGR